MIGRASGRRACVQFPIVVKPHLRIGPVVGDHAGLVLFQELGLDDHGQCVRPYLMPYGRGDAHVGVLPDGPEAQLFGLDDVCLPFRDLDIETTQK